MKRNDQSVAALLDAAATTAMNYSNDAREQGTFPGAINTGDIEDDNEEFSGDVTIGDIEVPDFEFDGSGDVSIGAVLRSGNRKMKKNSKVEIRTTAPVTSPAIQLAAQVADVTKNTGLSLPGMGLDASRMSPLIVTNATVVSSGTQQKIGGFVLAHNLKEMLCQCVWRSDYGHAEKGVGEVVTVKFGGAGSNPPAPATSVIVPMIFINISSGILQGQPGARLTVWMTGKNRQGVPVAADEWVLNRSKINVPVSIVYIPYVRVADSIVPQVAEVYKVFPGNADPSELTVNVKGLTTGEQVQVILPGLDSTEFRAFIKEFNLKF